MSKISIVSNAVDALRDARISGAGSNLYSEALRLIAGGSPDAAAGLLKTAAKKRGFVGSGLEKQELAVLKNLADNELKSFSPMDDNTFRVYSGYKVNNVRKPGVTEQLPLTFNPNTFPVRMSSKGFVPLTGVDYNKPSITLSQFGKTGDQFTDEAATNLVAAWNLNPADAQKYAKFYQTLNERLKGTGIPIERVANAFGILSAQRNPVENARLLETVLLDPEGAVNVVKNRDLRLALEQLGGANRPLEEILGTGKRYNFSWNLKDPNNPNFVTLDTRWSQNAQGLMNRYKYSPFAGQFTPFGRRYQETLVPAAKESANRLGVSPAEAQAGQWGNWRNIFYDIPMDVASDTLSAVQGFDYNPTIYRNALKKLGGPVPL